MNQWRGALRTPRNTPSVPAASATAISEIPTPIGWFDACVPTINQHGPSCCGQAWANWMECMVRRYVGRDAIPRGYQIDGYAIWAYGRQRYWNGDMSGGLYLWQGFHAGLDMGVIPPYSALAHIPDDPFAVRRALDLSPLVQGHIVGQQWADASPVNGCVDHSEYPSQQDQGHATLRIGLVIQANTVYYPLLNSWGESWGWNGIGLMSARYSEVTRLDDEVYTALMPTNWTDYRGWRDFLTKEAK